MEQNTFFDAMRQVLCLTNLCHYLRPVDKWVDKAALHFCRLMCAVATSGKANTNSGAGASHMSGCQILCSWFLPPFIRFIINMVDPTKINFAVAQVTKPVNKTVDKPVDKHRIISQNPGITVYTDTNRCKRFLFYASYDAFAPQQ